MPPPDISWLAIINSLVLLGMMFAAFTKYRTWRQTEEARELVAEHQQELTIARVCKEFTNGAEYKSAKDQRISEVADTRIDAAFRQRAESFVDSGVYTADQRALRADLARISEDIKQNTAAVSDLAGRLSMMVGIGGMKK